jgi:hypothetical protein
MTTMRKAIALLLLSAVPAFAQEAAAPLNFDITKLCDWQNKNNSMDVAECTALETEAQKAIADLEAKADAKRKGECTAEANSYSGDSGFASYTVYAGCLKDGPGSL